MLAGHSVRITLLTLVAITVVLLPVVSGDEEGGAWLVSQHEYRELSLTPSLTLSQWAGARMTTLEQQGLGIDLMSVHNNTYFVILIQSNLNGSLSQDGVAIRFAPGVVWAYAGGGQVLTNDTGVRSAADLTAGELTVIFGKTIGGNGTGLSVQDDTPYSDFAQVVAWNNGSSFGSLSFAGATPLGFELLHYIQLYPTQPLIYASVIVAGGIGFIFVEARKYSRGKVN